MLDILELVYGRFMGGASCPAGSYLNPRTMCLVQTLTDATLPQCGTFVRVDPSGSQTTANIATALNTLLNTSYTAGSFHTCGAPDNLANPGQASDDA